MSQIAISEPQAVQSAVQQDKTLPVVSWICCLLGIWPVSVAIGIIDASKRSPELQSHYQYMLRTVCVGFLYLAISFVLSFVLVGVLTTVLTAIWYYVRCIKGLIALSRDEAIANPKAWLF